MLRNTPTLIKEKILDSLFPVRCLGCKSFDTWLCADCHSTLPLLHEQKCPLCERHTPHGATCLSCLQKPDVAIDGVFVASPYKDKLLRKTIHFYKYRFVKEISEPLALLIAQALVHTKLPTPDLLIPVPLHPRRLRWRGFNQAEELVNALDLQIEKDSTIIQRTRFTKSQVESKSKQKRQKNLAEAFSVNPEKNISGKSILLIDDITTTATTLNECARVLKKAGAHRVTGLVIARD